MLGKDKLKIVKNWRKEKYIPAISTFYRRLCHCKETGYTADGWMSSPGRPPIGDINKTIDLTMKDSVGMMMSVTDIRHILEAEARKTAEAKAGCSLQLSPPTVSAQTVRNYKSLASVSSTSQIVKSVQQKQTTDILQRTPSCLLFVF